MVRHPLLVRVCLYRRGRKLLRRDDQLRLSRENRCQYLGADTTQLPFSCRADRLYLGKQELLALKKPEDVCK